MHARGCAKLFAPDDAARCTAYRQFRYITRGREYGWPITVCSPNGLELYVRVVSDHSAVAPDARGNGTARLKGSEDGRGKRVWMAVSGRAR